MTLVPRRAALMLLLVPLLSAAECKDGSAPKPDGDGVPEPISNPAEPDDRIRTAAISAWVENDHCPYTVAMSALDTETGSKATLPEEHVASGQFTHILAYPRGHRVQLDVKVTASRPGSSKGYVVAKDGRLNRKSASFGGTTTASITLFTGR